MRLALILLLLILQVAEGVDEPLREVQASEILTKIEQGQPVEYDHVIITGDLNLSNLEGLPTRHIDRSNFRVEEFGTSEKTKIVVSPIRITNSVIDGIVSFNNIFMENIVDFTGSTFDNYVCFNDSIFNRYANFKGSIFKSSAYFTSSTFNHSAFFWGSTFNNSTYFRHSTFNGFANFIGSIFNKEAYFRGAIFNKEAYFIGSAFRGDADFMKSISQGNVDFTNSTFYSIAYFKSSTFNGNANFTYSTFSYAHFMDAIFNKRACFSYTTFNKDAYFIGSILNENANFIGTIFYNEAIFIGSTFNSSDFLGAQFNRVAYFKDAQFNGVTSFDEGIFKEYVSFDDAIFKDKLSLNKTRYNKLYIRWYNIKNGLVYDDAAYLSLLKNFKELGYLEDYDCCYFEYRRLHRSQDWPAINDLEEAIRKAIDYPLEWFYGYGTKPLNPLGWAIITILLFGIIWRIGGLKEDKDEAGLGIFEKYGSNKISTPRNRSLSQRCWSELGILMGAIIFSVTVFLSGTRFFIEAPALPKMLRFNQPQIKVAFTAERILGAFFSILFFIAIGATIVR